mgnify:CR=1 FL=1
MSKVIVLGASSGVDRELIKALLRSLGENDAVQSNEYLISLSPPCMHDIRIPTKEHGDYRKFEKRDKRKNFKTK